jgi:hypothetical protein
MVWLLCYVEGVNTENEVARDGMVIAGQYILGAKDSDAQVTSSCLNSDSV